jgi:hypothetical protein
MRLILTIRARRFTLAGPFFCRIFVTNIACFIESMGRMERGDRYGKVVQRD